MLSERLLTEGRTTNRLTWVGRAALLVVLVTWGWSLMTASIASNAAGASFLHLVNLPFHEAGHVIFSPLGRFMGVLGGTLGQLLIPALCLGTFLLRSHNPFGAAVALWWLGENFLDIAPYINDARTLDLVLLGGVTGKQVEDYHDWEYLLGTMGWLPYDQALARGAHALGAILMALSCLWGGALLLRQWPNCRGPSAT